MSAVAGRAPALTGLVASEPLRLPFAPNMEAREFRLERGEGDLLVYAAGGQPGTGQDATRRYLNHSHEAGFLPAASPVPLFCHENERKDVENQARVRATFSRRHSLGDDFEAIPTPGHTPGATSYLWEHGDHRYLFTGDTVYLSGGDWVAGLMASSDRRAFARSLELIRELEFDVLVPWVATAGHSYTSFTSRTDTRRRIDRLLAEVRSSVSA